MSEWEDEELSPQEFTICIVTLNLQKRQKPESERFAEYEFSIKLFQVSVSNGSPKTAGILVTPASQAAVHRPLIAGTGRTPDPLASLAEDDNKVCLPAKSQRSSTLGIGTVNAPFSTLQEKARRHLPPHASLRRAKLGVFARESAK